MGVYYICTRCNATQELAPGAPGFGQMRVPCATCGGEARYAPGGAPVGRVEAAPSGPVANPTVPMQTPEALLALDAQETAATVPVEGLSEEVIARYLGQEGVQRYGASALPAGVSAPVHIPGPPTSDPGTARMDEPDIEEQIPTRAVAGLADRDIAAYASGLYQGLGAAPAPVAAPAPAPQAEPARAAAAAPKPRAFAGEPEMSASMFNMPGLGGEPGWGDSGPQPRAQAAPRRGLDDVSLAPLGQDRFTGEFPAAPPPTPAKRGGGLGVVIGIVVVLVVLGAVATAVVLALR